MQKPPHIRYSQSRGLAAKLALTAFLPFVLSCICISGALIVLSEARAERSAQSRARQVVSDCQKAKDSMVASAVLLSFFSRARSPKLLEDINRNLANADHAIADLHVQLDGSPEPIPSTLSELEHGAIDLKTTVHATAKKLGEDTRGLNILQLAVFQDQLTADLTHWAHLLAKLEQESDSIYAGKRELDWTQALHKYLPLALATTVALSLVTGLVLGRNIVARLEVLSDKVGKLSKLQVPEQASSDADEIGDLDRTFSSMAASLVEGAEGEQAAISGAADLVFSVDSNGLIQAANEKAFENYGWQLSEIIASPLSVLLEPAQVDRIMRTIAQRESAQFEAEVRRADGTLDVGLWTMSWSHKQECMIVMVHNITERKSLETMLSWSESRLRLMMDHMPAALLILSEDGRIRFANTTASQLFGRIKSELEDKSVIDFVRIAACHSGEMFVGLMIQRTQPTATSLFVDGNEKRVKLRLRKFESQTGQNLYLLIAVDETDRAQFDELRQRLIAMMVHDIGSPLATVQGSLSLIACTMLDEFPTELQASVVSAERLSTETLRMFKNLMRFHSMAAGLTALAADRMKLQDLTDEALELVAEQAAQKGITLSRSVDPELIVVGDAARLAMLITTVLRMMMDTCAPDSTLTIHAARQQPYAVWSLTVSPACSTERLDKLRSTDPGLVPAEGEDIEMILSKLLVAQCAAQVSVAQTDDGCRAQVRLPSLSE